MYLKISSIIAIGLLTACASSSKKPAMSEHFITDIKADGSKLFAYSLMFEDKQKNDKRGAGGHDAKSGRNGGGHGHGKRPQGPSKDQQEKLKRKAYTMLEQKLGDTGYCRQSYIELSNDMVRGRVEIKGECKEMATEADRDKFVGRSKLGLQQAS